MNLPWYTPSEKDLIKKEEDFSRQPNSYSPLGNLYQINYANNASKNSKGRVFLQSKNYWWIISKKELNNTNLQASSLQQDYLQYYDSIQKVSLFFFGQIHQLNNLKELIFRSLKIRSNLLGNLIEGKYDYLIDRLFKYNTEKILKTTIPTAITTVVICPNLRNQKEGYTVVRSNNKLESYDFMIEGSYTNEEAQILLGKLNQNDIISIPAKELGEDNLPCLPLSSITVNEKASDLQSELEFIKNNETWKSVLEDHEVIIFSKDLSKRISSSK